MREENKVKVNDIIIWDIHWGYHELYPNGSVKNKTFAGGMKLGVVTGVDVDKEGNPKKGYCTAYRIGSDHAIYLIEYNYAMDRRSVSVIDRYINNYDELIGYFDEIFERRWYVDKSLMNNVTNTLKDAIWYIVTLKYTNIDHERYAVIKKLARERLKSAKEWLSERDPKCVEVSEIWNAVLEEFRKELDNPDKNGWGNFTRETPEFLAQWSEALTILKYVAPISNDTLLNNDIDDILKLLPVDKKSVITTMVERVKKELYPV